MAVRVAISNLLRHSQPPRLNAPFSSSRLVSDRIINLTAVDEHGRRHSIRALSGKTLLHALKDNRLIDRDAHRLEDLSACTAECQVSVGNDWLEKLPPRSDAEFDVLRDADRKGDVSIHSRLGCQILLAPTLEGMVIAVAEQKPWDIA